jgi:hypothetical protein
MARPIKLTDETINKLASAIEQGATLKLACKYAGVSYDIVNDWLHGRKAGRNNDLKVQLVQSLEQAEASGALYWLGVIRQASEIEDRDKAAKHAEWMLERRYQPDYGRNSVDVKIEGDPEKPVKHEHSIEPATIAAVLRIYTQLGITDGTDQEDHPGGGADQAQ